MKVLDLRCAQGHSFEGWFGSEDDYTQQLAGGQLHCPMCGADQVTRMPSAPRLNLSGAREPQRHESAPAGEAARPSGSALVPSGPASGPATADPAASMNPLPPGALQPAEMQAAWLNAVRELMKRTEDVGPAFAEEARRIHYGESEERAIRGQATPEEREALREEGIDTVSIPVPAALKGPVQ